MAYLPNITEHTIDPDYLYVHCLHLLQGELERSYPDIPSLDTGQLLWMFTTSSAHAAEIAFRVFGALGRSDPTQVPKRVAPLLLGKTLPRKEDLYDLWCGWCAQHSDWPVKDTLLVPMNFLVCRTIIVDCMNELARRRRHLPVFEGWMGLRAGQGQSDAVRRQRFLDALDTTLTATVHRRLDLTQDEDHDPAAVVLLGAAERQYRAQTVLVNLLLKGGSIRTNLGQLIDIPSIPVLSIRGMEHADGMDAIWRHHARRIAFAAYAALAPGVFGVLETALPDAAKAVELAGKDRADAKKRGGSGGRKAKMAGTLEPVVQHLPIGNPTDEDSPCISPETLADDRLNPQEKIEAQENETESMEDAQRAMRVAFDRWGESGQLMLESLAAGATDKDAAKAAGISAPALTKRLKTLKKKLLRS